MSLIVESKTDRDLKITTTSNDLVVEAQTINDLIIITRDRPITAIDTNYLLLEDGGHLLLEDGFKLILE